MAETIPKKKVLFKKKLPPQNKCIGLTGKMCKNTPNCEWKLQPLKEGEKRRRRLCVNKEKDTVSTPPLVVGETKNAFEISTNVISEKNQDVEIDTIQDKSCENPLLRDTSFDERVKLDSWVLNDRKNFLPFLQTFEDAVGIQPRKNLKRWNEDTRQFISDEPLNHQKFVSDYLSDKTPYRGLLLYHGLGSGKSGASIMTAEGFIGRQIVVLLPKSLRKNYEDEIKRFGDIPYKEESYWCFNKITLHENDSQNSIIYERFKNQGISKELLKKIIHLYKGIWMIDREKNPNFKDLDIEKKTQIKNQIELMYTHKYTFIHYNMGASLVTHLLKTFYPNHNDIKGELFGRVKKDSEINIRNNNIDKLSILDYIYNPINNLQNPFSNKVVVIDEIHNLTSQMAGSGINGPVLYELLMRAENCKLINELLEKPPYYNE